MRPKKGPSPKDISVALEIEKKCLYFMSRETNTELANLKEEEARYERLVKLFQDQIDALETSPTQLAPHTGITSNSEPCFDSVDPNTTLEK